jgi:hypothetical protein
VEPVIPLAQFEIRERTGDSCIERNEIFCPGWAIENIDRYLTPTLEHAMLVGAAVGAGFGIALLLALLSHGRRWLIAPLTGITGVLYTIPSLAFFMLLLPITGRGDTSSAAARAATPSVRDMLILSFLNVKRAPATLGAREDRQLSGEQALLHPNVSVLPGNSARACAPARERRTRCAVSGCGCRGASAERRAVAYGRGGRDGVSAVRTLGST